MSAASSNGSFRWQTAHLDVALAWHEQLSPKMAPISQRKHLGRDKFSTQFSLLKTQQYVDPAARTVTPTMYVLTHNYLPSLSSDCVSVHWDPSLIPRLPLQPPHNILERFWRFNRNRRQRQNRSSVEPRKDKSTKSDRIERSRARCGKGALQPGARVRVGELFLRRNGAILGYTEQNMRDKTRRRR